MAERCTHEMHDDGESAGQARHPHRACPHLFERDPRDYSIRFREDGSHDLLCTDCVELDDAELNRVCEACWREIVQRHEWEEHIGQPRARRLDPSHDMGPSEVLLYVEAPAVETCHQIMCTARQHDTQGVFSLAITPQLELWAYIDGAWRAWSGLDEADLGVAEDRSWFALTLSPCGDYLLVTHELDSRAALYRIAASEEQVELIREFHRGDYHVEHCAWATGFVERDESLVLVCASDWNRLDVYDVASGELLTTREFDAEADDREHDLDYFFCTLHASRDGQWLANTGWCWHPVGVVNIWSLTRWLEHNPYESEDGESLESPAWLVTDDWDKPLVWADKGRCVSWGIRSDALGHAPGLTVIDARDHTLMALVGLEEENCVQLGWTGHHVVVVRQDGSVTCVDLEREGVTFEIEGLGVIAHLEGEVFVTRDAQGGTRLVCVAGV